jgi:hypothetical protein
MAENKPGEQFPEAIRAAMLQSAAAMALGGDNDTVKLNFKIMLDVVMAEYRAKFGDH